MARFFKTTNTKPFRLCCPECQTNWDTIEVPSYCTNEKCGALVTFRTIKWTARELRKADGQAKKLARELKWE